jgi:hypothetical protein
MDASKSCKAKPNLYKRSLTWAHSSAGEHLGDIEGVVGSIPTAPTMLKPSGNRGFLLFWRFHLFRKITEFPIPKRQHFPFRLPWRQKEI